MKKRWDIFCKVVDNFGDVGVCWRLARQLRAEHGLPISLWIDDFAAAKRIITNLDLDKNQQVCDEITLLKWDDTANFSEAAEVVIEAFSCELPPAYLAAMAQRQSKWINLEYLSAEPWVDDFHAKPSPQASGLIRFFYFPGFTEKSGGLIRAPDIFHKNQLLADNMQLQNDFWESLRLSNHSCLKVSLFCYPFAPVQQLFSLMAQSTQPIHFYISDSHIFAQAAQFFGQESTQVGQTLVQQNLTLHVLPFLSQADYDKLLATCDLNFVRGEDSWIRAIWAAKPFIWQPYIQDENAHMVKLNAFLDLFYANYDKKHLPCKAHEYWSTGHLPKNFFTEYLQHLPDIKSYTQQQSAQLASQPDLAAKLVIFCNKL